MLQQRRKLRERQLLLDRDALTDLKFLPNRLAERLASAKQRNRNVNCAAHVWLKYQFMQGETG
jgi:hypothetical protein